MGRIARAVARRAYFRQRERNQGAHLIKALEGRYQDTFSEPKLEVLKLRRRARWARNAHNPHSRTLWFTALARELSRQLEGDPHFIQMDRPIYFVTIIDDKQQINPNYDREDLGPWPKRNPTWKQIRSVYSKVLANFDCIGMIDVAMYVSVFRILLRSRVFSVHAHALVWNTTEEALDRLQKQVRSRLKSVIPYTTSFDYRPVNPADFLQMVWYVSKMPRKQYQLWRRDSDRIRQYRGNINGVNSVRLYDLMAHLTLDQLTFSRGQGREVLDRVRKRLDRLRFKARGKPRSAHCKRRSSRQA